MKKSILTRSGTLVILGMMVAMTACKEDDLPRPGHSRAEIQATATSHSGNSPLTIGDFTVDHLSIGIQQLEMMFLHHNAIEAGVTMENGTFKTNEDSPLGKSSAAPKHLVLAADGKSQLSPVGAGETVNGLYNKFNFRLRKITEANGFEAAVGKSFFLSGKVDGRTVHIWLDSEDLFSAPSKSPEGYQVDDRTVFLLKFNFDRILANVNFRNALDFNGDGVVEIGPNNADANGSIYNVIKNNLASSVEFEKEV